MAESDETREEDLRRLLTDAIEVQLAALKAGISFWTEWIEKTTEFVQSASKTLSQITSDDQQARDLLLELVDASRATARSLTEIPRHTAEKFIEELDKIAAQDGEEEEEPTQKPFKTSTAKRKRKKPRPNRAGRVKA